MSKRMGITIIVLVVVFGGIFGFDIVRHVLIKKFMASYKLPPATISTVSATEEDWHPFLRSVGSLAAVNGVSVTTEASGIIEGIRFESGQTVEAGQSLVQLDDSIDVQNLKNAEAQLNLDQLDFSRKAQLYRTNAISKSDYDQALAGLQQAQANVNKALVTISQKNIRAPFAGRLGIRLVNIGQYLNPGSEIVTLQSLNPLYVNFSLPEKYLTQISLGQPISISVSSLPNQLFQGQITALNSEITTGTRGIDIQGTIPNDKLLLYPGSFADVRIYLPVQKNVVTLPQTAVTYSLYGDVVFLLSDSGKKDPKTGANIYIAHQQYVRVGQSIGNKVAVTEGVKAGDLVVSSGQVKLTNGREVEINNSVKLPNLSPNALEGNS